MRLHLWATCLMPIHVLFQVGLLEREKVWFAVRKQQKSFTQKRNYAYYQSIVSLRFIYTFWLLCIVFPTRLSISDLYVTIMLWTWLLIIWNHLPLFVVAHFLLPPTGLFCLSLDLGRMICSQPVCDIAWPCCCMLVVFKLFHLSAKIVCC
jgi:hypothetical protein